MEITLLWILCAALIVAGVLFAAAGIAGLVGKKQVEQAPAAAQDVVANVSEDIHTVQEARHART